MLYLLLKFPMSSLFQTIYNGIGLHDGVLQGESFGPKFNILTYPISFN